MTERILVREGRRKHSLERFAEKFAECPETGCWLWTGCIDTDGYSRFFDGRTGTMGHRWVMEYMHGPIPGGMHCDHLCRVRNCVRPEHLEIVTQQVNLRRGHGAVRNRSKTHCPRGHEYSGDNLYVRPDGRRECRKCVRTAQRAARGLGPPIC